MDDAAALDDHQAVARIKDEAQDLLGDDDGELAQLADLAEHLGDVLDDGRLDAFGRLIEDENLRLRQQSAGDGELLLLAAGEVAALAMAHVEQDGKERVDFVPVGFLQLAFHGGKHVLHDGEVREDHPALRHEGESTGDALMGFELRDVLAADVDGSALERKNSHERLEQRGLAHAVASDDGEDFLRRSLESHVVDDLALIVTGGEIGDLDHKFGSLAWEERGVGVRFRIGSRLGTARAAAGIFLLLILIIILIRAAQCPR